MRGRFASSSKFNARSLLARRSPRCDEYLETMAKFHRGSFAFYPHRGDVSRFRFQFWRRKSPFRILQRIPPFWLTLYGFSGTSCTRKSGSRGGKLAKRERRKHKGPRRKPLFRRLGNPSKKPRSHPASSPAPVTRAERARFLSRDKSV